MNGTNDSIKVISNVEIKTGNRTILKFVKEEDGQFIHAFQANSDYVLAAELSNTLTPNSLPCDTLILIHNVDTLRLNSRPEIFDRMEIISEGSRALRIE